MLYGGGRFLCGLCLRLRYASQYETVGGSSAGPRAEAQDAARGLSWPFPFRRRALKLRSSEYRELGITAPASISDISR